MEGGGSLSTTVTAATTANAAANRETLSIPTVVETTTIAVPTPTPPQTETLAEAATASAAIVPVDDDESAATAEAASLLREWNNNGAAGTISSTGVIPPVAPAVVLNETSEGSQNTRNSQNPNGSSTPKVYGYPVATYVSNFVRTSVNEIREIRDQLGSHISAYAIEDGEHTVLSTRSEPAMATPAAAPGASASIEEGDQMRRMNQHQHHHHHNLNHRTHFSTARSLNVLEEDNGSAEFVLVNGDLVALPPSPSRIHRYEEEEGEEDQVDSFYRHHERANCRSSRMRRSVKGLKKWMKKKKLLPKRIKHNNLHANHHTNSSHSLHQQQHLEGDHHTDDHDTTNTADDAISAAFSLSTTTTSIRRDDESIATTSSMVGGESPTRKKSKKKRNRLAWMRDIERGGGSGGGGSASSLPAPTKRPPLTNHSTNTAVSSPSLLVPQLSQQPIPPPMTTPLLFQPAAAVASVTLNRQASIAAEASFVGNADQLYLEAGVLPDSMPAEAYIEDRLDDYDKYDKKDDPYLRSMVPANVDFKVDKQEAPCVDSMLRLAGEFAQDLEASGVQDSIVMPAPMKKGKSDGSSVPLSMATSGDPLVHNDILKLVMVGDATVDKSSLARALRNSTKKSRKRTTLGVDVHSWTPPNADNVQFTIWDVQGATDAWNDPYSANFGAHPGTQSLFFADRSLHLLVWDLAANNRKTYQRELSDDSEDEDDDDDDEENENEYVREEANRQADRALQADIEDRVLTWIDCVARRGSHSAILPVALVPSNMSPVEAKRRCDAMQLLLMEHTERLVSGGEIIPPKVLSGAETVLIVSLETNMGMDLLEETILAIATDASHSVFDHVGTPVPHGTMHVLETTRRLKSDHKLVLVDHLMAELNEKLSVADVMESLHFLASIGEVLYFGGIDEILSHYVILSRKWMVSALSCIVRNDLKRELSETRRFMNMQCLYSDQQFPEDHVTQTFSASGSNCPLLSSSDTQMLWQSMSFMREAADKSAQLSENSTTASTMFGFLEHLLVHAGVFLPLDIDRFASPDNVYFVPSLLAQADSRNVWTFKSSESWMTTLSHSWLFRDGAPSGLMEHVTVALLRDLYEFSHTVAAKPHIPPPRSQTFPFAQNSLTDFMNTHDGEAIGHIKIHQMMCWKNSLLVKIGCVFPEGNELRESFVEVFVAIADQSSTHCVASDAMRSNMQRLIVSGKGQVGHHGRKLWKGGYGIVSDSIKASVAHCTNVDRQVVCPECLAHAHPSSASTWSWDSVRAAAESGSGVVRCMRGHRVDSNLICGTCKPALPKTEVGSHLGELPKKAIRDLLPSVVVVGLWDEKAKTIRNVGSGFLVDKKLGLVVTAGHILFDMEEGRHFGTPYFGLKHAKAVIGVIPGNGDRAVFRYFAEIVAEDIHNMDACVLKIITRMEKDVEDEGLVGEQPEKLVNLQKETLPSLKMTRRYELEETVRVLGFNQGGEGILEQGKHVNRSADFAKGYICKQFKMNDDHSSSGEDDDSSSSGSGFSPREEIVIMCPTISGHSGGPCVNDEGKVVGILSRADPVDRQRCYLVPSNELKILVNKAKKKTSRGGVGGLKMY